ncbi:IclR family transcriptional regulator [Sphingobium xenophagum]|uniref:IclR family transcriptional regulator n=1 Tax=Sphingobium xenophagum TaxID=121428 RepID=UPI0005B86216|nr:IclR family transcriptional regulator [Sphingobium xenophagum]
MNKIGDKSGNVFEEDKYDRKSIQSVEVGVRVLLALVETGRGEGAFLREVAEHSGLSRSQAHRYLLSFVNTEVVEQDERSGRYYLGGLTIRLGLAAMARLDTVRIAAEHLNDLLAEMKTTGLLSVWGDYGPTVIRWIDGGIPLLTSLHTGSVLPMQTSSSGILFLAHCPPEQTRERVERERAEGIVVDDLKLAAQIEQARRVGFSKTRGTVVPGLSATSVPVLDSQDRLVATMSILARAEQKTFFSKVKIDKIIDVARSASRAIGWQG